MSSFNDFQISLRQKPFTVVQCLIRTTIWTTDIYVYIHIYIYIYIYIYICIYEYVYIYA